MSIASDFAVFMRAALGENWVAKLPPVEIRKFEATFYSACGQTHSALCEAAKGDDRSVLTERGKEFSAYAAQVLRLDNPFEETGDANAPPTTHLADELVKFLAANLGDHPTDGGDVIVGAVHEAMTQAFYAGAIVSLGCEIENVSRKSALREALDWVEGSLASGRFEKAIWARKAES